MRRAWVVLPLVLVAGLAFAVYALRIEQVSVTGVRTLSPRTIVRASGLVPGQRILWERLSAAERRVERLPAVARAVAVRSLPSTVVFHVRERTPLARLDGARDLVVDSEGVAFSSGDVVVQPVLYGWQGNAKQGTLLDARSRVVLAAFPRFPESIRSRARKLRVGATFNLRLLGGTEIRFGGLAELEVKAQAAEAVLAAERGKKLEYVDVRSPSVPVSREKTPPTPKPTPTRFIAPAAPQPSAAPATRAPATAAPPATPSASKTAPSPLR